MLLLTPGPSTGISRPLGLALLCRTFLGLDCLACCRVYCLLSEGIVKEQVFPRARARMRIGTLSDHEAYFSANWHWVLLSHQCADGEQAQPGNLICF